MFLCVKIPMLGYIKRIPLILFGEFLVIGPKSIRKNDSRVFFISLDKNNLIIFLPGYIQIMKQENKYYA